MVAFCFENISFSSSFWQNEDVVEPHVPYACQTFDECEEYSLLKTKLSDSKIIHGK